VKSKWDLETKNQGICTRQFVLIVAKKPRFLSSQPKADLYIAGIASQSIESHAVSAAAAAEEETKFSFF